MSDFAADAPRFRDIFLQAPVGILIIEPSGAIVEANDALHRLLDYAPGELDGRQVADLLPPEDRVAAEREARQALAGEWTPFVADLRCHRKNGELMWAQVFSTVVRAPDGSPCCIVAHVVDLAQRKIAEAALRASEERYRGMIQTQQAAVMRIDLASRLTFVNERCSEVIGVPAAEMVGQDYTQWIFEEDRERVFAAAHQVVRPPYRAHVVSRVKCAGGAVRWFEWEGHVVLSEDGAPIEMLSVGRDVHERHLAEEALRDSLERLREREQQLRMLAERQVSVREEERRRLGVALHDGVCQELVGIGLLIELVRRRAEALGADTVADLARTSRHLDEIVEHVRGLARELRPMLLADLGLEGSLRSLAAGMTTDATVVRATFVGAVPRLADGLELGVYRIAQEALANALRHAQARTVEVALGGEDGWLRLEVRDDGRGFDASSRRGGALGLVSMEERAQALGGRFAIDSSPGCGTCVRVELPLSDARA
jgi:PAS domain S-box-containing protein